MEITDQQVLSASDEQAGQQNSSAKPSAYRVDDDDDLDEKDLKQSFMFGGSQTQEAHAPLMEGEGAGGQKFGGESHPPTGNDENNPSLNAGNTNAYLARTRPLEESPENNNFKDPNQQGEPDYQSAQPTAGGPETATEKPDAGKEGNTSEPGKADFKEEDDHKGPDYGSNAPEIPGPGETPDQQKVGGA